MTDVPAVPLWYNGLWFVGGTSVWNGYSNEDNKLGVSCIWGQYLAARHYPRPSST